MVGMTVEEIIKLGYKLIEKDCDIYDVVGDIYTAYYGGMVLVVDGKVDADLDG